jgi:hypothetical protein
MPLNTDWLIVEVEMELKTKTSDCFGFIHWYEEAECIRLDCISYALEWYKKGIRTEC